MQRTVLYLGEINDTRQAAWRKSLDALDEATQLTEQICLFPEDRDLGFSFLGHYSELCLLCLPQKNNVTAYALAFRQVNFISYYGNLNVLKYDKRHIE
jgi:hypothetical protein